MPRQNYALEDKVSLWERAKGAIKKTIIVLAGAAVIAYSGCSQKSEEIRKIQSERPDEALFAKKSNLESMLSNVTSYVVLPQGNYSFSYNITIAPTGTLEIEPGTELNFAPNTGILSYGIMKAIGTENEKITFSGSAGRWNNVALLGEKSSKSVLKYFTIRLGNGLQSTPASDYIGGFETEDKNSVGGGLLILSSAPEITNGVIENCISQGDGGGAYFRNFNGLLADCVIQGNQSLKGDGGGASFNYMTWLAKILRNKFLDNKAKVRGGGVCFALGQYDIYNKFGLENLGLDLYSEKKSRTVFEDNLFSGNDAERGGEDYFSAAGCDRPIMKNNQEQ